jgi:3D (Asp-Asp-Asp) domain-containing protein
MKDFIAFILLISAGFIIGQAFNLNKNEKTNTIENHSIDDRIVENRERGNRESDKDNQLREGTVTAYTSRPEETDSSPYTTADGTNLSQTYSCVVANNVLPFGTKVEIEGIGVCEVHDRGAKRHGGNWFDVYMGNDLKRAKEFGKRNMKYRIL